MSGFPVTWAPRAVNPSPNCPRGLDSLILTDRIVVKQQVELLEAFTDFETVNRYQVSFTKIFLSCLK